MSQNAKGTTCWARITSRSDETTRCRAASTPGGEPSPTPDHGCPSPSTISRPPGLRSVGIDTDVHDDLLLALELRDLARVRIELSRIGSTSKKASLLSPSKLTDFRWRTPLMAAAATGDIAIFQAVMDAFNKLFSSPDDCTGGRMSRNSRAAAMHTQLELSDVDGRTLLMHATKDMGVFLSVAEEILPRQARTILPKKDARGMTFLMHAASAVGNTSTVRLNSPRSSFSDQGDEHGQRATEGPMDPADALNLPDLHNCQDEHDTYGEGATLLPADPWVPLMRSAIDFARKILWMPEYRMLLTTRDMWERSILEHSVASGREQVFEACFNAVRKDIFDTEVDVMLEVAEDEESKSCATAMTAALKTKGGKRVLGLFTKKAKALKRDVALRAEASTVASKIQSFIPGNLIIIFQLLLPEFSEKSSDPLILLLVLCGIAPFWVWGSTLVTNSDPDRKNTLARHTFARYFLSVPAMFFWGVGTSAIGPTSFSWGDTASASALAVATIVIPALDSFFSGRGARSCWSKITMWALNFSTWAHQRSPSCKGKKVLRSTHPTTGLEVHPA